MLGGIIVATVLLLPGAAWAWAFEPGAGKDDKGSAYLVSAVALGIGLLILLLYAAFLLELGLFRPVPLFGGLTILAIAGLAIGFRKAQAATAITLTRSLPWLAVFGSAIVLIQVTAPRGEWLAGGWDPGVYMNQGIYAAQEGGWRTAPEPVYQDLAKEPFNPFMRPIAGRDELFPGIPMDPGTGSIRLTFYRLTPTWIALLHLLGGLELALHAFPLLWLLLGVLLSAGLLRIGASLTATIAATSVTLLHPLLLYHAHTPNSELMETLLLALLILLPPERKNRAALTGWPLVFLAGMLNRPTFLFWIILLLPWLAIRRQLPPLRALALGVSITLSLAYYHTLGAASLDRVGALFGQMAVTGAVAFLGSLALAGWRSRWSWRYQDAVLFLLVPALIVAALLLRQADGLHEFKQNATRLIPYIGWPLLGLSAIGFLIRLRAILATGRASRLDIWLNVCVCATLIPLGFKYAAELYPWATKRFLSSLPLALGLASAVTLTALYQFIRSRWKWAGHPLWLCALLLLLGSQRTRMVEAWRHTEYDGLSAVLHEIATHLSDDDVVVADHFLWATPLAMAFDQPVLNGERLWAAESPYRTTRAMTFLQTQAEQKKRRILILTGTPDGVHVFPPPLRDVELLKAFEPYTYSVIAHHRHGQRFPKREHTAHFRLYRLLFDDAMLQSE